MFKKMSYKFATLFGGCVAGMQLERGNIAEGIMLLSFIFLCDLFISYLEKEKKK